MRPLKQPGVAERLFMSEKAAEATIRLTVEHRDGGIRAEELAEKWSSALLVHGDAMDLLKEMLLPVENGAPVSREVALRIRDVLNRAGVD